MVFGVYIETSFYIFIFQGKFHSEEEAKVTQIHELLGVNS